MTADLNALAEKAHNTAGEEQAYWKGAVVGVLAADIPAMFRDVYVQYENVHLAQPAPYEQAVTLVRALPDEARRTKVLLASGALWAFKHATDHLPDADECVGCDRRIFIDSDDDLFSCKHGVMHQECRRFMCDCQDEPEFDKDAYYAARYGD